MDVILDVDTGVDDAMAILLAVRSPALRILGITCVSGNVPVDRVVPNTLKVLDVAGAPDIPVAVGMARPLVERPRHSTGVHGDSGLGNVELPVSARQPVEVHAVEFLRRTLLDAPSPVTLVPLGPLTNIAVLLAQHPDVAAKIGELIFMGGCVSDRGNATATAEFNVRHDPEAADIVLTSGLPITMYGLDVFRQVTFGRSEALELADAADPAAQLAGSLLLYAMDNYGHEEATVGDAGTVASVLQPEGLTTELRPVRVELTGQWTRGQTVVDRRDQALAQRNYKWQPPMGTEIRVAVGVDCEAYRRLFRDAVLSRTVPGGASGDRTAGSQQAVDWS